jgi:hypothetical protein
MIGKNNTRWLRDGDKTLEGIARAGGSYGKEEHPSVLVFRHLRKVVMDVVFNGQIDPEFE